MNRSTPFFVAMVASTTALAAVAATPAFMVGEAVPSPSGWVLSYVSEEGQFQSNWSRRGWNPAPPLSETTAIWRQPSIARMLTIGGVERVSATFFETPSWRQGDEHAVTFSAHLELQVGEETFSPEELVANFDWPEEREIDFLRSVQGFEEAIAEGDFTPSLAFSEILEDVERAAEEACGCSDVQVRIVVTGEIDLTAGGKGFKGSVEITIAGPADQVLNAVRQAAATHRAIISDYIAWVQSFVGPAVDTVIEWWFGARPQRLPVHREP